MSVGSMASQVFRILFLTISLNVASTRYLWKNSAYVHLQCRNLDFSFGCFKFVTAQSRRQKNVKSAVTSTKCVILFIKVFKNLSNMHTKRSCIFTHHKKGLPWGITCSTDAYCFQNTTGSQLLNSSLGIKSIKHIYRHSDCTHMTLIFHMAWGN